MVLLAACSSTSDQKAEDTGQARADLTGSTFESTDGNLIVNGGAGAEDWANAPNLVVKLDKPSGSGDDSFGQGSKEDTLVPTVVSGSIPPNKSDLSRFYVAHETVGGQTFLYLAWERTNVLGSANMDFEFNQSKTLSGNNVTPVRTTGDLLITFDFTNGGGNPVLGLLKWVTSGSTSQCFASNSLPCWGNRVNLSDPSNKLADGAVNTVDVIDPIDPGAPRTLPALTFGEAAINLTSFFPTGQCENLASAYLKSRSSASFTAELKDFIAPTQVNISNCGTVNIIKLDNSVPPQPLQGAVFTLFIDDPPLGPPRDPVADHTPATCTDVNNVSGPCTCTTDASGKCSISDVPFGAYWVVETTTPAGFTPAADQSVSVTATTPTVTVTLTDNALPGQVNIHKQDDLGNPLVGAEFTLFIDQPPTGAPRTAVDHTPATCINSGVPGNCTCTTDASGNCSIMNVPVGFYWVEETMTPAGYFTAADQAISITTTQLTVDLTFSNPRKFHTIVIVCQDASGNGTGPSVLHSSSVTVDGVQKTSISSSGSLDETTLCGLGGARYTDAHLGSNYTTLNVSIP